MAISQMAKVMIVSHRTEVTELLESLQGAGICQILNAEEAMVSKEWPELCRAAERPRQAEELLGRLEKSIAFLKSYSKPGKGLASVLAPRTVVEAGTYKEVVSDEQLLGVVEQCEKCEAKITELETDCESIDGVLEELKPWVSLETAVEEMGQLEKATCLAGLLSSQKLEQVEEKIIELGGVLEVVGSAGSNQACLVICLNENLGEVQKLLRSADFETFTFEGPQFDTDGRLSGRGPMTGTVEELIEFYSGRQSKCKKELGNQRGKAKVLAENLLKLEILYDHWANLLSRERSRDEAPATDSTVILEGWVRRKDYSRVEKIISGFGASSLSGIEPREGEEIPVEIENRNFIRPFEVVTRLYGMPQYLNIDPTIFLAPFFALFFALCLTDAGYGLVMIAAVAYFIKKMQGDKKLMWMLGICSVVTVAAGALTGGWFGDAVQQFVPKLGPLREKMIWFDPLEKPMMFFGLSLALGYFQILTGLVIAFIHNLKRNDYAAAIFDQLTWLVMLNSVVIFGASKMGAVRGEIGGIFGKVALVPAIMILLFSERQGNWAGRLGMGAYNLFSAIFYMGDVLSYLRLMALGMVTAGLAMAINVIAGITFKIPYGIGIVLAIIVLVGGHGFNLAISGLSAFVHTLRLQYVEFFPKFLVGGGKLFSPLSKEYKHIYVEKS
jgi:V/A-type H+-transporting ATPase subunit I